MTRPRSVFLILIFSLAGSVVVPYAAHARPSIQPRLPQDGGVITSPVPPEEAKLAAQQDAVGNAMDSIEKKYPSDFSYSTGGATPTIGFRAAAPKEVSSLLEGLPVRVSVKSGLGFTKQDVEATKVEANDALLSLAGGEGLFVSSDETGAVTAILPVTAASIAQMNSKRQPMDLSSIEAQVKAKVKPRPGVSLRIADGVSKAVKTSQWSPTGGTSLTSVPYGGLTCTSAFVVKKVNALDLGPLTAGHCPGSVLYHSGVIPLEIRVRVENSGGDVAFYRSPVMMAGVIQSNYNVFRSIYYPAEPPTR